MVDISPLKKYIETPDNFMVNYIPHEIARLGLDKFLHLSIASLDSSKVWNDGLRPIQTISYIYVRAITEIVYTINTYVESEEDKDEWFKNLLIQHEANVEYEKTNPPIDYDAAKPKKKTKSKSTSNTHTKPKEKKQTAAERRLAEHIGKINALNVKLKPKNNGNNII